jgi:CRISPR/Cas system-associated exonuclease Cas4 (RecB family)
MPVIRVSEIAEYVYCARAWWLRRAGGAKPADTERLQEGSTRHQHHGLMVRSSTLLVVLAGVMLLVAALIVVVQ